MAIGLEAKTVRGMALMAGAALCMGATAALIRHVSASLHPFEVAFFRSLFGLAAFAPLFMRYGFGSLSTRRLGLHGIRAVFLATTMLISFWALSLGDIAKVVAIAFSAPLIAGLLAVVVLGEALRWGRMLAMLLGISGTLVVVRPGFAVVDLATWLALIAAVTWAVEMLIIKILVRTESSVTTTVYMGVLGTPVMFLAALPVWQTPSIDNLLWLVALGALGTIGHLGFTQAFKLADMTVVLPLNFIQISWVALLGFLLFDQVPETTTWIGSILVIAGATLVAIMERTSGKESTASR